MSYSITCPHCQAVLKSPKPVRVGKNVKCPKCQQMFTVGAASPSAPVPADSFTEDDEMAAAIAKLEAEQSAAKAPVAPAPKPMSMPAKPKPKPPKLPVPAPEVEAEEIVEDVEIVEDDPPTVKKKKRREEEDEPPPPKKSRRRDEDEEDDKPRSKKRRDDEEDDDKPTKKQSKKKGGSMMLIGLLGGGFVALLLCTGCGVGGYFVYDQFSSPDIVGTWESNDIVKSSFEFRADRTGTLHSIIKADFRYRQERDKLMIQAVVAKVAIGPLGADLRGREVIYTVRREGDTLIMREDAKGTDARFRKVR